MTPQNRAHADPVTDRAFVSGWMLPASSSPTLGRWYWVHFGCQWRGRHGTGAPSRTFQSRWGALFGSERLQ